MIDIALYYQRAGQQFDCTFTMQSAGILGLFGPSGSGKTTMINMIAGLIKPDHGHCQINGQTWQDSRQPIFIAPHKRAIGYVFQEGRLFPHLRVADNLDFGRKRRPVLQPVDRDALIDLLDLRALLGRFPDSLSGGERQRVALGRALLSNPALLLMDEPLAALDQNRKAEIIPFIEKMRDHFAIPIIYVSHAVDEIARLADQTAIIQQGSVIAQGETSQILARLDLPQLTDRPDAISQLPARITGHLADYGISEVTAYGRQLLIPKIDAPIGATLRLQIRASDVTLAKQAYSDSSALNQIAGTITALHSHGGYFTEILVDIGGPLRARITRYSAQHLDLKPGMPIYAHIKAIAIGGQQRSPWEDL